MLTACDSVIFDEEGDCSVTYRVKFRYDYNMKFADAFAHEVKYVTLYVIDENGHVVWQHTESGKALATENYFMTVDVAPGTYDLLAWCSGTETGLSTFTVPDSDTKTALTCTLNREHDEEGAAYVRGDLDHLYHGWLKEQTFNDIEGIYNFTVPLVKNTNNIRVVLQHLSGEPINADKFTFSITGNNGFMNWDNNLLPDEQITYYARYVSSGEADIDTSDKNPATAQTFTRSAFSAAIAELTVARLITGQNVQMTITNNETGETVFSYPLIDLALLLKSYDNKDMDNQEYLDRQDEYNMVFFLDEGDRWTSTYIYINSWRITFQQTEL